MTCETENAIGGSESGFATAKRVDFLDSYLGHLEGRVP